MTTEQYLNQLKTDKQNLVNNLVEKGVSATNEETFTTLVPKVLDISGGGTPTNMKVIFDNSSESIYPETAIFEKGRTNMIPGYYFQASQNQGSFQASFSKYITNITLSSDIQTLGVFCFSNMTSLTNINLDYVTEIEEGAFSGCNALLLDRLPDNIILSRNSFQNCKKITLTELPSVNTSLPYGVFDGCSSITNFTLKDGVDISNSQYSFQNCSSMSDLTLPNDATIIPVFFCNGCTALQNINLNDNINAIDSFAFLGCGNLLLERLPSNLTTLGSSCFYNCSKLTLNSLPSSLTSLGSSCFYNCSSLSITEIPEGVTNIQSNCFYKCSNLVTLNVLGNITVIKYNSFQNSGLTTLSLPNVSAVPKGDSNMFSGTPIDRGTGSIYVPDALVENFKSATNWSDYADVIKPISEMA